MKDIIFSIDSDSGVREVMIENGDLVVGDCDNQNISFLCLMNPGNMIEYPKRGISLIKFLHGTGNKTELSRKILSELSADGVSVSSAKFDQYTGELILDT